MSPRRIVLWIGWILLSVVASAYGKPAQKYGKPDYFQYHEKGWHWYDDPEPIKSSKPTKGAAPSVSISRATPTPSDILAEVRKAVKGARAQAVLVPTEENIVRYIQLQQAATWRATRFQKGWQLALMNHPELDFNVEHPEGYAARQAYWDKTRQSEAKRIKQFFVKRGLFFFYRSTCPYCQKFAPIVKTFSERYDIPVIAITTDGIPLPEFPDSKVDHGQAAQFHVTREPALYAVDPYNGQAMPVTFGLSTLEQIGSDVLALVEAMEEKGQGKNKRAQEARS